MLNCFSNKIAEKCLNHPSPRNYFKSDIMIKILHLSFLYFKGAVLASASVDGTVILWDVNDGSKMNVLSQENGEGIRSCAFRYKYVN